MAESVIQRAFSGGELAPALAARADQVKYSTGLSLCRNFIVQRHGGVVNRSGLRYTATAKLTTTTVMTRFVFEGDDQTYLIEVGDKYLRWFFHGAAVIVSGVAAWNGGTAYVVGDLVVDASVNYYCVLANTGNMPPNPTFWHALTGDIFEIPTPYLAADVKTLKFVQSADIITITHKTYAPRDLQRVGHTNWQLTTIVTKPSIAAPTNVIGAPGTVGAFNYKYVVTAGKAETFEESLASTPPTIILCEPPVVGKPNTLSWDTVPGAVEYYIHLDPYKNGIFGYIGTSDSLSFNDVGFAPDFTITPPNPRTLFDVADAFPAVASYYQQRLLFARSNDLPEQVWGSQVGAFRNFSISTPLQDDDSVTFVLASLRLNPIAHLIPLSRLMILTDEGEWVVLGDADDGALLPTRINADQVGYAGANADIAPIIIGESLLYVQARGRRVRDIRFKSDTGLEGRDLTIFSSHLFEQQIVAIDFQQMPFSTVWVVRADGTMVGLTYLREHEILAWHRHDTDGLIEDVEVIPDTSAGEDIVYVVVKRTIEGTDVRYIERFSTRQITNLNKDAFFVDSGLTYEGPPKIATITGLDHLDGEIVAILADGQVVFDGDPTAPDAESFRVSGGTVQLPFPATDVHAGLPIRFAEIETLDLDVQGTSVRDKRKNVRSLTVLVDQSARGFCAGPDVDHLIQYVPEQWEANPSALVDGALEINMTADFSQKGRVRIRHTDPLPFELLGIIPNLELGG